MSSALYSVRLMWHGERGDMASGGVWVTLFVPPAILQSIGASEIEFVPELRVARIRGPFDKWRDMNTKDVAAVRAWLTKTSDCMRLAIT